PMRAGASPLSTDSRQALQHTRSEILDFLTALEDYWRSGALSKRSYEELKEKNQERLRQVEAELA
ncbi:MAG: hypothetical protein HY558_00030, partial [Euryarchaeota archaeon]|nr:hypothetical protein [Euryarchaeota archaeon]